MNSSEIGPRIAAYFDKMSAETNHRYRSWEHCYHFFRKPRTELLCDLNIAALHLGFYLASWGMYRGSGFLLQHDYMVHKSTVEALLSERLAPLWRREIGGAAKEDEEFAPLILEAARTVKASYRPFGNASDTLATKVLLGTLACVPACDRFFIDGFKQSGQPYSSLNLIFVRRIIGFCAKHLEELRCEQHRIRAASGTHYPLMKLADMLFWQIGFESAGEPAVIEE